MAGAYVSDFTKKTLAQFGWTEKDGIPEKLGEFLIAAKDRSAPTTRTDVLIDMEKMRPEDVEIVQKMMAEQREKDKVQRVEDEIKEKTKNMLPEVAAAYEKMVRGTMAPPPPPPPLEPPPDENAPEIVDDRDAPAAETPAAAATEPQAEPPQQEFVRDDPPPPPITLPFCPRCGWDMRMKYDIEVTDLDKEGFVAILLGNSRFKKRYEFLNGKFIVTLRSLLADENIEIHRQLVLDNQAGELPTENEWFLRMFEYRLACSVESAYTGEGKPIAIIPALAEVKHTPPEDKPLETGLVYLRKYVNTQVLAHEVTRRMVGQKFRQFQRLIEALEAMAVEPSFWEGIG